MWSFRCVLQLLACGFCKIPTARCFSECPLVVTAPQHGPYNPQTGAALLFAAWGNITKLMSVFSSQNVTGSNAQTNLDTLYTGWTRLPHMLVPSCDLQQAHTVTCPRVDMQRGHRRHLPDLSTRVFTSAASGLYSHNKVPPWKPLVDRFVDPRHRQMC